MQSRECCSVTLKVARCNGKQRALRSQLESVRGDISLRRSGSHTVIGVVMETIILETMMLEMMMLETMMLETMVMGTIMLETIIMLRRMVMREEK